MSEIRGWLDGDESSVTISPILDVMMNALGAILIILMVYVYLYRGAGPPIIIISEERPVYSFESGSSEISDSFRQAFEREYLPELERYMKHYRCNVIEVVGHTDAQPVGYVSSNLDRELVRAYHDGNVEDLQPGSNVDLGMMRALAIIEMLREYQREGRLADIEIFHPASSGQMIMPDRQLAENTDIVPDRTRRRIEIRVLRSTTRGVGEEAGLNSVSPAQ